MSLASSPTAAPLKPTISTQSSTSKKSPTQRSASKTTNRDPVAQEDDPTWGSNFWVTLVDPKVVSISLYI